MSKSQIEIKPSSSAPSAFSLYIHILYIAKRPTKRFINQDTISGCCVGVKCHRHPCFKGAAAVVETVNASSFHHRRRRRRRRQRRRGAAVATTLVIVNQSPVHCWGLYIYTRIQDAAGRLSSNLPPCRTIFIQRRFI